MPLLTRRSTITALALLLAACGPAEEQGGEVPTLRVATKIVVQPNMDFLKFLASDVAKDHGIRIEPVGIEDTVLSDTAMVGGDIDANFQQHRAFLDAVNVSRGWTLVAVKPLFFHIFAIYSTRHASLAQVGKGARVALNADPSNLANALRVLEEAGLVTLRKDVDPTRATLNDIATNPRGLTFVSMKTETIARALDDIDLAVCQAEVFRMARIDERHRLHTQQAVPPEYMNQLVVRAADKDKSAYRKLVEVFSDPRARKWLEEREKKAYFKVDRS